MEGQLAGFLGGGGTRRQCRGEAVPIHAQAYHRSPLEPFPAERTSQRRVSLASRSHRRRSAALVPPGARSELQATHGARPSLLEELPQPVI